MKLNSIQKKIIILAMIITIGLLFWWFWFVPEILIPAELSVLASCNPEEFDILQEEIGVFITGRTFINDSGNINIEIFFDNEKKTTLKHELVHLSQLNSSRWVLLHCGTPILKTLTEVEAYLGERLPDGIFEFFYGEININNI